MIWRGGGISFLNRTSSQEIAEQQQLKIFKCVVLFTLNELHYYTQSFPELHTSDLLNGPFFLKKLHRCMCKYCFLVHKAFYAKQNKNKNKTKQNKKMNVR